MKQQKSLKRVKPNCFELKTWKSFNVGNALPEFNILSNEANG
jgi:hypothetical protein